MKGHFLTLLAVAAQPLLPGVAAQFIPNLIWFGDVTNVVRDDLIIDNLTIQPGAIVEVAGPFRIEVRTKLLANGTASSPITVRSSPDSSGTWLGLRLHDLPPGSAMTHCEISGASDSALDIRNTGLVLVGCRFSNNASTGMGGAVRALGMRANLEVRSSHFAGNISRTGGAAIHAEFIDGRLEISDCQFEFNLAGSFSQRSDTQGGAVSVLGSAIFLRTQFNTNETRAYTIYAANGRNSSGGALYLGGPGSKLVAACSFAGNAAQLRRESRSPDTSRARGGAIHIASGEVTVRNCLIVSNFVNAQPRREMRGSAVFATAGTTTILNSTVLYNVGAAAVDGTGVSVRNSIIWENNALGDQIGSGLLAEYCNIFNSPAGQGNLDRNPALGEDWSISGQSPCIDAGDPRPEFNEVSFPPSLGSQRSDIGFEGGPWSGDLIAPTTPTSELIRLNVRSVVSWPVRENVRLFVSPSVTGPFYSYAGPIYRIGEEYIVIIDDLLGSRFYSIRPETSPDP